jgi:tRNA (cmo5U34)-methyltransferase
MVGAMSDFVWDPDTYLAQMLDEVPGYEELEAAVVAATEGLDIHSVLELGTGTGETAVRILARHPGARWTGIDASGAMLGRARERMPDADLRVALLQDPLPAGPFDLVVSVLAVHHLDEDGKRDLFTRVAQVSDNFVLGDLVVPERAADAMTEPEPGYDLPSSVPDQLAWLGDAGFESQVTMVRGDLAVFRCRRR